MGFEDESRSSDRSVWNILLEAALNPTAVESTGSAAAVTEPDAGTLNAQAQARQRRGRSPRHVEPLALGPAGRRVDWHGDGSVLATRAVVVGVGPGSGERERLERDRRPAARVVEPQPRGVLDTVEPG